MLVEKKSEKRHQKVYFRLISRTIPLTILVALLAVLAIYLLIRPLIEQREAELQHEYLIATSVILEDSIDKVLVAVQTLSSTQPVISMQPQSIRINLENLSKFDQTIQEVLVIDTGGQVISNVSPIEPGASMQILDMRKTAFFVEALKGNQFIGQLHSSEGNVPLQILAVPVLREGKIVGVIAARVSHSHLMDELANKKLGESGISYITDSEGVLIAHGNSKIMEPGVSLADRPIVKGLTEGKETRAFEESSYYINEKGREVVASSLLAKKPAGNEFQSSYGVYGVIVEREMSEALLPLRVFIWSLLVLAAFALLAVTAVIVYQSRVILSPLYYLNEGAAALASGKMGFRVRIKTGDDIEALGDTFNNMAERLQRTIENLSASESLLRTVMDNLKDGLVISDKNLKISYVNAAYCMLKGYSKEELTGTQAGTLAATSESRAKSRENLELRKKGVSSSYEYEGLTKDGKKIPYVVSGAPIMDNNGVFQGSIAIFTDLTEVKKLQQEKEDMFRETIENLKSISEANTRFRAIVQNMAEAIILIDENRIMVHVNPAYARLTGYSKEEVLGKKAGEVSAAPEEKERLHEELSLRKKGISAIRQMMLKSKSGEIIPVLVSAAPMFDAKGNFKGSVAIFTDLREIQKLQQKREKMASLAAIGELAAIISHDLRNPLGAINNSIYFLKTKLKDGGEIIDKHLDLINHSINSCNRIIDDLLDYSRPRDLVLQSISLNSALEDALSRFKFPQNIEVSKELDSSLPLLEADPDMIVRVFVNLIANSLDSMSLGGTLQAVTRRTAGSAEAIVKDTGKGITPEVIAHIFDPFFTTKAKGTGLGLYICKQIIEKHRGEISVESQVGRGTIFTVKLPLRESVEASNNS